jgi:hypothetical protein
VKIDAMKLSNPVTLRPSQPGYRLIDMDSIAVPETEAYEDISLPRV